MSSDENQCPENERKIRLLMEEIGKLEQELERVEQEPTEEPEVLEEQIRQLRQLNAQMRRFSTQRRRLLAQLRQEVFMRARTIHDRMMTIGENVIIELRAGVIGLNQRMDQFRALTEDVTCPICLLPWSGDGRHCLVSLRCGHLFGKNCIHTAIRRSHRCPICRRRAYHADVRRIYGRSFLPP
ncbi:uncharacterized protein LOC108098183 [Drosophila ficusphila]|uniref:uncharacterized protein LOC108098183 n=1 Tax=Drosophila ficusphila TaxID=30025 RepID=UPI0007E6F6D7|nr:uncharacterized protein LOC108098183 [Drosophila ficusphila]